MFFLTALCRVYVSCKANHLFNLPLEILKSPSNFTVLYNLSKLEYEAALAGL